jgi:sulfur-oxidizing protein SoxY
MGNDRRKSLATLLSIAVAAFLALPPAAPARAEDDPWPDIRQSVFQGRDIKSDESVVQLYVPEQAEDAAAVPIDIRLSAGAANSVRTLTLIIDRNPAPVAATFRLGDAFRAGPELGERKLATRIRVDSFSNVRVIAETADGTLHMATKFVRGAGGCSAPASKDAEAALADLGKMQVKVLKEAAMGPAWREAIVMIHHPNFTGMQMDPISRGYTPARFVNLVEIRRGAAVLLSMEGGISISENPNIRFTYDAAGDDGLEIDARDNVGGVFKARSTPSGS